MRTVPLRHSPRYSSVIKMRRLSRDKGLCCGVFVPHGLVFAPSCAHLDSIGIGYWIFER